MTKKSHERALVLLKEDLAKASNPRKAIPSEPVDVPDTLLLTGGTAFIGVHVLWRLVTGGMTVVCLMRGDNEPVARARLTAAARKWGVPPEPLQDVSIVLGDCAKPSLGLSPEDYDHLVSRVDAVAHFAMRGTYHTPYARYRRHWLGCLYELIDFCLSKKNKSLHVAGSFNTHFLYDDAQLQRMQTSAWQSGYSAYKLVAMRALEAYQAAGAHFVWYDLPLAVGDEERPIERADYGAFQIMDLFLKIGVILQFSLQVITPSLIADALFFNLKLGSNGCVLLRPITPGVFTGADLQSFFVEQRVGRLPVVDSADPCGPDLTRLQRFLVPKDFTALQARVHCQMPVYPPNFEVSRQYDAARVIRANAATWTPLKAAAPGSH